MGERNIEYGKLYKPSVQDIIYSAYNDHIKYLNPEKVIDKTMPVYGETPLDIDNLIKDMKIMAKHKNICFGTSGAFSITSCITDVISYSINDQLSNFFDRKHEIIKISKDEFLLDLLNFIK